MEKFESEFWTTETGTLRNCFMFDTFDSTMYLNGQNELVWLKSREIEWGKLVWTNTPFIVGSLKVWNIVKAIIEEWRYNSIPELFEELNFAFSDRITRILDENNNNNNDEQLAA